MHLTSRSSIAFIGVLAVSSCALLSTNVVAQGAVPGAPGPGAGAAGAESVSPVTPPVVDPAAAPPPSSSEAAPKAATTAPNAGGDGSARGNRPTDAWALGIGAGWFFPSDLFVPNTASVRVMFPGSVTLEPFVNLSLGGSDAVQDVDEPENFGADFRSDFTGSNYTTALGSALRVPIFQRGNLDLQLLASASASYSASANNGDQTFGDGAPLDVVTEQQTISLNASYGAGIEWFFLEHMGLSLDAQNPLATWSRTDSRNVTDIETFDPNTGESVIDEQVTVNRSSAYNVGAIFSPSVRLMFHLYF